MGWMNEHRRRHRFDVPKESVGVHREDEGGAAPRVSCRGCPEHPTAACTGVSRSSAQDFTLAAISQTGTGAGLRRHPGRGLRTAPAWCACSIRPRPQFLHDKDGSCRLGRSRLQAVDPRRCEEEMVGAAGFEPATSSSRTKRATELRHAPMSCYANSYRYLVPLGSNPDTRSLPQRMDRRESSTSIRSAKYRSRRSNPSPSPGAPISPHASNAPTRPQRPSVQASTASKPPHSHAPTLPRPHTPQPPTLPSPHHAPRRSNFAYIASISSS